MALQAFDGGFGKSRMRRRVAGGRAAPSVANMGRDDRLFRCILGLALFQLVFVLDGPARILGLAGLLPIAAGLIGWSPLYAWLGIITKRVKDPE